jgi:hypothetical protein
VDALGLQRGHSRRAVASRHLAGGGDLAVAAHTDPEHGEAFGAPQAVGRRGAVFGVALHACEGGQLVNDHVRPRPAHGLRDLLGIERVGDHGHGAQLGEHRPTRCASCRGPRDPRQPDAARAEFRSLPSHLPRRHHWLPCRLVKVQNNR